MPELPEVEVLRLSLERLLPGDTLTELLTCSPSLREPLDPTGFSRLVGGQVERLHRRSKYLLIDCSNGLTLVIHLGMSGRLTVVDRDAPLEKHEHLALALASGRRLRLVDPRRFGLAYVVDTASAAGDLHFAGLGIEPLDPEFTGATLAAAARGRTLPVKAFLLAGAAVVGVGNIYACEALFHAGIDPRRAIGAIDVAGFVRLAAAIRDVLGRAIAQGGTTLNDFADGLGNAGYFQVELAVYDREGQPCATCGATIERIVQANRSSFFCPRCQAP
jgi:formamidopyrimidine-DNA glycosylase